MLRISCPVSPFLYDLKQHKLYELYHINIKIMARERMVKYGHFEGRIGHIIINFMIITKSHHQRKAKDHRFLGSWPSDGDLELTVKSAML